MERREKEEKEREKEERKRQERRARDAFKELLRRHRWGCGLAGPGDVGRGRRGLRLAVAVGVRDT